MGIFNKIVEWFIGKPEFVNIHKMDLQEFYQELYDYGTSLGLTAEECINDSGLKIPGEVDYIKHGLKFYINHDGLFAVLYCENVDKILFYCFNDVSGKTCLSTKYNLSVCKRKLLESLQEYKMIKFNEKIKELKSDF